MVTGSREATIRAAVRPGQSQRMNAGAGWLRAEEAARLLALGKDKLGVWV